MRMARLWRIYWSWQVSGSQVFNLWQEVQMSWTTITRLGADVPGVDSLVRRKNVLSKVVNVGIQIPDPPGPLHWITKILGSAAQSYRPNRAWMRRPSNFEESFR